MKLIQGSFITGYVTVRVEGWYPELFFKDVPARVLWSGIFKRNRKMSVAEILSYKTFPG